MTENGGRDAAPRAAAWLRLAAVLLVVGAGLAALWWLAGDGGADGTEPGPPDAPGEGAALVGQRAPDFALASPEGETVRLSDLRGRPVLVNFWATWCGPCLEEMPAIQRVYDQHAGSVAVVAVNFREGPGPAAEFAGRLGLTFPVVLDRAGEVAARYGVPGLPSSYFIDAEGVVRAVHFGPMDEETIRQKLAAAGSPLEERS
ncbi:MAG TPA: TlpA disulfide reductase family protein [Dehalococcoidia bacterium]